MLRGRADETCPHCYHVLIDLARFDARDDPEAPDSGGLDGGGGWLRAPWEADRDLVFMGSIWSRITASIRQRRLDSVLRRWPRSLYCSGCGYILKRS